MNLSASPYHARQRAAARADARPAGAGQPRRGRCSATWSAARTSSSSTATAWRSTRSGEVIARAPQFEEALTVCDDRPGDARDARAAARPAPPRRGPREPARARRALSPVDPWRALEAADAPSPTAGRRRPWPSLLDAERGGLRGAASSGCATTSTRTASSGVVLGLSGGIDSALAALLAVDALGPERVTCVVMPSPYSSRRDPGATPATIAANLGIDVRRAADRAEPMDAYDAAARRAVRGTRARHRRGEPPGAHPRQPADGAVEQVRLAGADDRQQVRDLGRLRDALRRHGGRLRAC